MWDQTASGSSYYFRKRKAERDSLRLQQKRQAAIESLKGKLKRISAQIRSSQMGDEGEQIPAWAVLYDLSETTGELFSTDQMTLGEEVSLILEARETVYLRARVIGCHEVATTGTVISVRKYKYRVALAFLYNSVEEQTAVVESLALAAA